MTTYTWIKTHRQEFPVKTMCRVLGVARAAFYAWTKDPTRSREQRRAALV